MKRKKPRIKTQYLVIAGIVILLAVVLRFTNVLDITGTNPHTITVDGHAFTAEALPSFGSSQFVCGGKQPSVTDESTTDFLKVTGKIPSTGGRDCSDYIVGVRVTLTDVDLTTKERVIIRRAAKAASSAKTGNGYSSDLNGLAGSTSSRDGPTSKAWGDVTITNDRAAKVLRIYGDGDDANGKIIPYSNNSVHFANEISTTTKGIVYGGEFGYMITGVEVTDFPALTPAAPASTTPTSTTPTTPAPSPPDTQAPPEAAHGFLARLWAWITGWLA